MLIYLDLCLYTDINISLLIEWVTYCMLGYIRLDWVRFWLIQYTILGWTMGKFRAQGVHQTGQQSKKESKSRLFCKYWPKLCISDESLEKMSMKCFSIQSRFWMYCLDRRCVGPKLHNNPKHLFLEKCFVNLFVKYVWLWSDWRVCSQRNALILMKRS